MKRRNFLKGLLCGGAALVAPQAVSSAAKSYPVAKYKCTERFSGGIVDKRAVEQLAKSLIATKEQVAADVIGNGIVTRGSFPHALWPGVKKWSGME